MDTKCGSVERKKLQKQANVSTKFYINGQNYMKIYKKNDPRRIKQILTDSDAHVEGKQTNVGIENDD